MKSEKMMPPMNSKPLPPVGGDVAPAKVNSKLQEMVDGCSDEECQQLLELLEERMGADIDGDEEAGEPAEHAEKTVPPSDEEPLEE